MTRRNLPGVDCAGKHWICPSLGFSADKVRRETRNEQQLMELWLLWLVVILFVMVVSSSFLLLVEFSICKGLSRVQSFCFQTRNTTGNVGRMCWTFFIYL